VSRHQITTNRLILRPFKAADADVVVACLNDFQVSRWLSRIAHPFTHADLVLFNPDGSTMWPARVAITLDGAVVGGMGALDELGYWLAPEFWGQGIATEAARALVDYRFETSDIAALTSGYFAANAALARVLEKIGFSETGRSRRFSQSNGAEIQHVDMLLTRAQWEAS